MLNILEDFYTNTTVLFNGLYTLFGNRAIEVNPPSDARVTYLWNTTSFRQNNSEINLRNLSYKADPDM